jgi:hypothetical protein
MLSSWDLFRLNNTLLHKIGDGKEEEEENKEKRMSRRRRRRRRRWRRRTRSKHITYSLLMLSS